MPRSEPLRLFTQPLDGAHPCFLEAESSARFVLWTETQRAPALAAAVRQAILTEVYEGDYHQDVSDLPRLASVIRAGAEKVFFWGDDAVIERLRAALEHGGGAAEPNVRALALQLGTATFLDRSDRFGPGIFELGRTGSLSRSMALTGAKLAAIDACWQEAGPAGPGVIYCTPRNRASAPGIPGGMGIQRFHQRVLRSVFLGFAPWHIMPGHAVEWLEFRAIVEDPVAMEQRCRRAPAPVVVGDAARALCDAIMAGLGLEPCAIARPAPGVRPPQAGREPRQLQASFESAASVQSQIEQDEKAFISRANEHSTLIIQLCLEDETAPLQAQLIELGFKMLALELPSRPGQAWTGQFVRVHPRLEIVEPAYFRHVPPCPNESALMALSRSTVTCWRSMETLS